MTPPSTATAGSNKGKKHGSPSSTNQRSSPVKIGPDINSTRAALDKKQYRLILLPNGLRAILISDTVAMHQMHHASEKYGHLYEEEDEESISDPMDCDDEDGEDDDEEEEDGLRKAAAAMVVGAGSYHDPVHLMGLAHFLEHMLFMGTTKYPTENAYDHFLSSRGGSDNAFTELEHTLYHFEIPQEDLWEAMDMFAQFFHSPLLMKGAVDRELESIESEFQLSKNSDGCRLQQLMCHTSGKTKEEHPFSKFSWGNNVSLREDPKRHGVDIMKELKQFYDQYYHAGNMRLVVVGAYSLDELQEQVLKCFADVPPLPRSSPTSLPALQIVRKQPNTWNETCHSPIADFGLPLDKSTSLCRLYRLIPVRDCHQLTFTWQLPPQRDNWKTKPADYLAHLLGHEAGGSLLSSVKAENWATSCAAGVGSCGYENSSSHALFSLSFTLSTCGVNQWHNIATQVYTYIGMIKHHIQNGGLPNHLYEELCAIQKVSYEYADESSPADLVEELAEDFSPMRCIDSVDRILDGTSLLFGFDADAIEDMLSNYLTPHNARVDLFSSTFGRASDFQEEGMEIASEDDDGQSNNTTMPNAEETNSSAGSSNYTHLDNEGDAQEFVIDDSSIPPQTEPMFGTRYWCHTISHRLLQTWQNASSPSLPPPELKHLTLPPVNPFIPTKFDLKALPADDSHHPLLHCSLKLCVTVGKRKSWFPATVTKYNSTKNVLLLHYEDDEDKWHYVDLSTNKFPSPLSPNFEGTFDQKSIKYKVVSVPKEGEGAVLKFGDVADFQVEVGNLFPPIPPPLPLSRLPQLVVDTQLVKLWHLQDRKFKRPIAELRLKFVCQNANLTPAHRAITDLFACICRDAMTETCYQAIVCEIGSTISVTDVGFTVRVNGFDDKLLDLMESMLSVLLMFRGRTAEEGLPESIVKDGRFEACLEVLRRSYGNSGMSASALCTDVRLRCLRTTIWGASAKMESLKDITIESFIETLNTILDKISVEAFYHGNCDRSDAETAQKLITNALHPQQPHPGTQPAKGVPKKKRPTQPVIKAPYTKDTHTILVPTKDSKEPNTAVEVYFQVGKDDMKQRVLIDLLCQIMYEPLFDQLRTKEQFGYAVSCSPRWTYGVMGMSFQVVTSSKSASEVTERLETFLTEFHKEIIKMTHSSFSEHLAGLAKNKLEMYNSLEEECNTLWSQIVDGKYDWESHRVETIQLRNVTKEDMLRVYEEWFLPACHNEGTLKKRRRLVVHVIGTSEGPASLGRPFIPYETFGVDVDEKIKTYHKAAGHATWGKIL